MISVVYLPNPFQPSTAERYSQEWRQGLKVDDVLPGRLQHREALTVAVNGVRSRLDDPVAEGDVVAACALPRDPLSIGLGIGGSSLMAAGAPGAFTFFGYTGAAAYGLMIGAMGGLALVGRLLMPGQPSRRRDDNESPTYGFNGQGNVRREGQPKPIVYGLVRVAGTVINECVIARQSPAENEYRGLVELSEGAVEAIAGLDTDTPVDDVIVTGDANFPRGVHINGIDASDLKGIELSVRMGANEQEVIDLFEDVNQLVPMDVPLESTVTTSDDNFTDVFDFSDFTTSTADDHFEEFGRAFDFTQDYDAFTVTVNFQAGLYRVSGTTATLKTSHFRLGLRYIELTGSGDPINTGGPEGDGYVRLPPEPRVSNAKRLPFGVGFRHDFYDPQTYTHGGVARACVFTATSTAVEATPTLLSWTPAAAITSWTWTCWINSTSTANAQQLFNWADGSNRGLDIELNFSSLNWVEVNTGNGVSTGTTNAGNGVVPSIDTWYMVTITYGFNVSGTDDRLRIYINGVKVHGSQGAFGMQAPAAGTDFTFGAGAAGFVGRIDEAEFLEGELTPAEVLERYNAGVGVYQTATAAHVGLWHFDATSTTVATDSSGNGNDLALTTATIGAGADGLVAAPPATGTIKRSRYRVEVVRVNQDSNDSFVADEAQWQYLTGHIAVPLSYPNAALLGIGIKSQEGVTGSIPTITALVKGRKVPVWDGLSVSNPEFSRVWSRNPAWIALDIILDSRIGLGAQYASTDVEIEQFQGLAEYADELIYDLRGQFEATGEWVDIVYTGASGVGTLEIEFDPGAFPLVKWAVGDAVGFDGVPQVGANPEINNPAPGGYTISAIDPATYKVTVDIALSADPWTSGTALSAHEPPAGTVEGREPRYCYDGVFDTQRTAWDALMQVFGTALAMPVRRGKKIGVKWERPRTHVDIVGMGSIVAGSLECEYGGNADRENSYVAEFLDAARNYDKGMHPETHPSVQDASSLDQLRQGSMFLEGICRRSQVARHLAFMLNVNNLVVREVEFDCSVDALPYEVGDVLLLSHDVTGWSVSGRIYAAVDSDTVKLDRTVVLAGATTYTLWIRNSATGQYESRTVSSVAGTYTLDPDDPSSSDSIDVGSAFSFAPQRDDPYVLSVAGEEMYVQITSISLAQDLSRHVEAVEYQPDVYDLSEVEDVV